MKSTHTGSRGKAHATTAAFTLVEVVVASAILAVGLGGILLICSNGIRAARILDRVHVDAGSVATMLSLTNQLEEGADGGSFGEENPGYVWSRQVFEAGTNGLYQADMSVYSQSDPQGTEGRLSILLFRPATVRRVGR